MILTLDRQSTCFGECNCVCGQSDDTFDRIAEKELVIPLKLQELCRQNIGWYCDRTITDHQLDLWDLEKRSGLYFLWHKNDYCSAHGMFHMRALYVGKGAFSKRMRAHWERQPTKEEALIYFTFVDLPNRIAKYAEQLLLDCYDMPLNRAENNGRRTLCAHFTQGEVD